MTADISPPVIDAGLAHCGISAFTTTRLGGCSVAPYDSFNLGDHVGDRPDCVDRNRAQLGALLPHASPPVWLRQEHGTTVIAAHDPPGNPAADAVWTDVPGVVCSVMTADCLPVVLADPDGRCVAIAHGGWRGLAAGVLEATLAALPVPARQLRVWFGPAIGPQAFEVGDDVKAAFGATLGVEHERAFSARENGKYLADLYCLARLLLARQGVTHFTGGDRCTYGETDVFFSYRREGRTGRMGTFAFLQ